MAISSCTIDVPELYSQTTPIDMKNGWQDGSITLRSLDPSGPSASLVAASISFFRFIPQHNYKDFSNCNSQFTSLAHWPAMSSSPRSYPMETVNKVEEVALEKLYERLTVLEVPSDEPVKSDHESEKLDKLDNDQNNSTALHVE